MGLSLAAALGSTACVARAPALTASSFGVPVDSFHTRVVARGVSHAFARAPGGPWALHVLSVQLDRCTALEAAKGAPGAAGRRKTSDILRARDSAVDVVAGVNADFFSLQTGVPTNALVMRGRVVTPPARQPVFAIDSSRRPRIEVLRVASGRDSFTVDDTALARVSLAPVHPLEAVGGRPRLVRDSSVLADVDSIGGAGFATTRHPRTAVGIAGNGRRVLLVVVDGRQPAYSSGMTNRELARLMLALGAHDALNLDGGGSTTMVVERAGGTLDVVNRPSDPAGERPVGNALAVVRRC